MFRKLLIYLIPVIMLVPSAPSCAAEFQIIGFDSVSMGGAGTAMSRGSFATYYNPALLAEHKNGLEVSLSAGLGLREVTLAESLDNLSDIGIEEALGNIENYLPTSLPLNGLPADLRNDVIAIQDILFSIPDTNGLELMPSASLGIQVGNFGFGFYGVSEGTGYAVVDKDRLDIIVETSIPGYSYVKYDEENDEFILSDLPEYEQSSLLYALDEGKTYIQLTGLAYTSIPVAYARQFNTRWGTLDLGGAFNVMPGYTFDKKINIDTESGSIKDEFDDAEEYDTSFGVDIGLFYEPQILQKLSLGLVAKNINTPKFDTCSGEELEVKPQVRGGVAYDLFGDKVTLALDADLTKNETFIPDYFSQFVGGGIRYQPFDWFSVRGGAMQNIQESQEGTIFTTGFGFGFKQFQLDLAGQCSTKQGEYDGQSFPRYSRIEIAFVSKW
ncbi:MAG: conjugal transfer protein TraF [Deltaproteobacteria bacterium]|nr:conjugal transfer protein TraF [Deltaproteobacteria bacterium]